ncbi:MAG: autotransporter-associated beta strand repeat-containing protein [Verrucomicrobia bacterium]|nr:autotransporter-associated beta strand repeat-containing protein [Verrucomicrobiota bacterium]
MNSSAILRLVRTGILVGGLIGSGQTIRAADLIWKGNLSANWDATTANWLNGAVPAVFTTSDNVTFDDSATTSAVTLGGVVTPGSVTVNNSALTYSFAGSGGIVGTGPLHKSGAGLLTILTANTYSGGTTIHAGSLQLGNGGTSGSITGNLVDNGTLIFNRSNSVTFAGLISGFGGLTKAGTGTLTLTGANTYTGGTTISAGTLRPSGGAAIPDTSPVTLSNTAGAILNLFGTNETIGSLAGGGGSGGNVALGSATLTTGGDNSSTTYAGIISGSGGLTKAGTGTLTLTGANAYTGNTTVSVGTLALANAYLNDTATLTIASGGVLNLTHGNTDIVGTLVIAGVTQPNGLYGSTNTGGAITGTGKIQVGPSGNQPPTVAITSPADNASVGSSFTIDATAADGDGTIASVAFYDGANLLGTVTTSPYSYAWSGAPAGSHALTAVAQDNGGLTTTSAVVHVTVAPTVTLGLTGSPLAEDGGVATVTATLSGPTSQDVIVNLAFAGTATLTIDYTPSGTSIVIPAGQTNGSITLTAVADTVYEPANETIIVDIDSVINGLEDGTQQVIATIIDKAPYRLDSATPDRLTTGDQVVITGAGFGDCPENLCMVVPVSGGSVPLRVLTATDTQVVAVVGCVPPGGGTGPLMFAPGTGVTSGFQSAFRDLAVTTPAWTLTSTNSAVVSTGQVTLVYSPPPTNTRWFFNEPASLGTISLVLTGSCGVNAQITAATSLRMGGPNGLTDIDVQVRNAVFQPGGSAYECARRICDMIACAALQNSGVEVTCTVTPLPGGAARITLTVPGGTINPGSSFCVCVTEPSLPRPVITSISPLTGGRGTIFTVTGSGFAKGAQNNCFMFGREDGTLQGSRVMTATETQLTVQMDIVTAAKGGPGWRGMLVTGTGNFSPTTNAPGDLPGVTFAGTGDPAMAPETVTLEETPLGAGDKFDDSTGPTPCNDGGVVSITLDHAECVEGTILKIDGHWEIQDCNGKRTHVDAWLAPFTYHTADGTCAQVIENALNARFYRTGISTAGFPITTWIDTDPTTGKDRLNLACDSGDPACPCCIVASWVRVNYCPPAGPLGTGAQVSGVSPSTAGSLQDVVVSGSNLGTNPDDLCLMQVGTNGVVWPLRATLASGTQITARTAPIPAGAQAGPVMVMGGQGVRGPAIPVVWDDLVPGADGWFFRGIGQAVDGGSLTPNFSLPPRPNCLTGELVGGRYSISFSNPCPAGTVLDIQADFSITSSGGTQSVDEVLNGTVWTRGGTALDCAKRVCDLVTCGLSAKLGVRLICEVASLPGGVAKVTFSVPNGTFNYGYVGVCLTPPPTRPTPVIFDVFPLTGTAGDVITILGANFGNNPASICAVIQTGTQLLPLQVLTAQDDLITAELSFVPVDMCPSGCLGRVMVALGNADPNPPVIPFPDVQLGGPFWAWGKVGDAAMAPLDFVALPGVIAGQSCISAQFVDGRFCLLLDNPWPANAQMCIIARGHNAAGQGGDTSAGVGIYPAPGSTPLDCARRLAAILTGEFIRQSSIAIVTTVDDLGDGVARLCIAGATQPLTSGWLSICFKPCTSPPPAACANPTVAVYSAGTTTDDFAGPEPAQPSAALVQRLAAAGITRFKGFDDCTVNTYFAHTFANLPPCIVDARLRIRLKACGDYCENDSFNLQFTLPSGAYVPAWGRYLGNGNPGGGVGLFNTVWSAGTVREITLNLADLTNADGTKTDLLPKLNQYGFLDLAMQDDTAIDFAELQIMSCCCHSDIVVVTPTNACCAVVNYTQPVFTSQCGAVTVVCTPPPGTCFPIGTTVVTCVGTDTFGQQGRCVFKVTVVDTTPPVITSCPSTVIACMGGDSASGVLPNLTTQVVATDNCTPYPQLTITQNPPPGTIVSGGTVVFTVTDASGNVATCQRPISVQPCCTTPPGGLVLWLPFDERAGPSAMNAAGGNNGTLLNGLTHPFTPVGYVWNSLCFDGLDDYVQVASYPAIGFGTGDFTVDAWVKPAALESTIRVIVDHRESSNNGVIGYSLFLGGNNTIGFQIGDGNYINYPSTLSVPADGQWHLVAVTVHRNDTKGITFYLDGVAGILQRDTTPFPGSVTPAANFPLRVGARSFSPDGIFNGCIDEVELFNRSLAATEIQAVYNARSAGKCKHRCTVPWDTPIGAGASSAVTTATIYNPNPTAQTYQYSFQGLPVGPHCNFPGPTSFSPASGTISVPAGGNVSFPVTVGKPAGMPCGAIACFQMVVIPVGTGERFGCEGSLYSSCNILANPSVAVATLVDCVVVGVGPWTLVNTSAAAIDLTGARFSAWGPDMQPDTRVLSLNGLPPGVPVLMAPGTILPLNGQLQLPLEVQFMTFAPGQAFTLLLEADTDGDGEFEPLASMEVQNVIPPALSAYDAWAALHAGGQAANLDYNNDGVANGIAYFMGMNDLATNPGVINGKVNWPHVGVVASFEVQVSDNLADWRPANPADVDTTTDPGLVTYTMPSGAAQQFCRLSVTP